MITSEKLVGSENYLSWSASVELWFMGQGYEDHLITRRQISLSQQDLDLSTYIGQIASLKEEFLTVMPLTPDVGAQQTQLDKFFMVLTLIGLHFAIDSTSDSSVLVSQTTLEEDAVLHGRPPRTAHMAQSSDSPLPQPPSSSASQASVASVAQPGNASACLTHTSSLGPWILDSGASDHLSGNKDLFSSITTTSALPTVTLANGSQTVAKGIGLALPLPSLPLTSVLYTPECPFNLISISKITRTLNCSITFSDKFVTLQDRSTGKTIGIGRESQGLYHLTSIHLLQFAFPLMLLSSFTIVWATLVSPSSRRWSSFFHFVVASVDNAREYFSAHLLRLCLIMGFFIKSSCAHTPQQNGVAERKNRHLVETAHSSLPSFPDQPLYFLPPRVFGCTCFVHILTPGQDKLSAKAMKCLFLGYSRLQKGYRCYSLETHRYFISADVTFFEDSPFFSTTSESLPVSEVLPIPIVSPPDAMPPRPLQVYHRRPRVVAPLPFPEAPADSLPIPSASPAPALPSPNDLPIAVRKGTRSTRNPHPIYNFLSYHRLSSPYSAFVSAISSVSLPKSTHEALSHPGWRQAMVDEMAALHSNGTWDLVVLPSGKSTVGCRWVYAVKVGPDGQVDRLKARLVAKGYTQVYGSDYGDTFSPVAKIASVRLLLHGCYVFLASLSGESGLVCRLRRSLYGLKQSPRAWFSRFSSVVQEFGMLRSSDQDGIQKLKQHLFTHFQTKDLGKLKYFLGIEIAQSSSGVVLSQRKYALDILEETGMLDCKPVDTPMDPNVKLVPGQGEPLGDPGRYRRLVGKLNYLTITRPDISFPAKVLYENRGHTQVVGYTDADWAGSPTDRRSTSGYCVFIGELRFGKDEQMKLICDNQAALHIASNPVFHERTKHIEVDCHFIREKIASGCVATSFVNSNDQLADIFTKSLRGPRIKYICNKLGAYDVYAPA
ncbi:Retrovirus-related Pol polyprotein from transposon RE1 [Vitis vinifera]|uniref:Retrovirus-related Pol polyprotein from transposon RE1 n=1 Tax=Vitis vinifera TaxID=29760 RepID=A0A438BWC1_VITVI|nr:Retrovirus-related Pol polyprotein from transposon RE1 [Vitis vinifera]